MHRTAVKLFFALLSRLLDFDISKDERMSCCHWRASVEGSSDDDDDDVPSVHLPIYTNDALYKSIAPLSVPAAK